MRESLVVGRWSLVVGRWNECLVFGFPYPSTNDQRPSTIHPSLSTLNLLAAVVGGVEDFVEVVVGEHDGLVGGAAGWAALDDEAVGVLPDADVAQVALIQHQADGAEEILVIGARDSIEQFHINIPVSLRRQLAIVQPESRWTRALTRKPGSRCMMQGSRTGSSSRSSAQPTARSRVAQGPFSPDSGVTLTPTPSSRWVR